MATPLDWAKALLNRLGLPQTQNRLVGLVAFAQKEGGHFANSASQYNVLNTCRGVPGSRNWGGPGCIQAFPDWSSGIEATALTMGQPNMAALLNALIADADPMTFLQAVTDTPWCPRVDANGNPTDCASYATGDPYAIYNSYAGKQDSSGTLDEGVAASGTNWKLIGGTAAILLLGGGVGYWIMTDGGRKPLRI